MMRAALGVEWLKLRRSRVPRVSALVMLVLPPAMAALFLVMAGRSGGDALSLKVRALMAHDGWAGYLDALVQVHAVAGLLGAGVVAWCFGREFSDRTVVSLFASATPREAGAAAKLVVLALWCAGVSLALVPAAVLVGLAAGLGLPDGDAVAGVVRVAVVVGAGAWFPWALPGSWAVASSTPTLGLVAVWHLLVVPCSAAVVGGLTVTWWRRAELV